MDDITFPPLGNPSASTVAATRVAGSPPLDRLVAAAAAGRDGTDLLALPGVEAWLVAAIRAANDAAFRFELTDLRSATDPRVRELPRQVDSLSGIVLASEPRAKLRVLVGLAGDGGVDLTFAGTSSRATIREGDMVIHPTFLCASAAPLGGTLTVLDLVVAGPTFR